MSHLQPTLGCWKFAVETVVLTLNRRPTSTNPNSSYSIINNRERDLSILRIFGSRGYGNFPQEKRAKFAQRGIDIIFLGYSKNKRSYQVFVPDWKCIKDCRSVKLAESELINCHRQLNSNADYCRLFNFEIDDKICRLNEKPKATSFTPRSFSQLKSLPSDTTSKWRMAYFQGINSLETQGGMKIEPFAAAHG